MSLSDFEVERIPILRRGSVLFHVRGLNVEDLTVLVKKNLPDIEEAFRLYNATKTEVFSTRNLDKFFVTLVSKLPGLVAEVISHAADEPDETAKARKLPLALQVLALTETVNATFEEVGDLKNLFATLAQRVQDNVDPGVLDAGRSLLKNQLSKGSTGAADET